jgi:hypothetical protein
MPDDGVDFATVAANFNAEVDDASPEAGGVGMAFVWSQMAGGGTSAARETMRLSAAGALTLIGVAGSVQSGIAKVWCVIEDAGTLQGGSFNIASITDNGTGDRTIVFDTDFADTNYSGALAMMQDTNAAININLQKVSIAVGSIVSYCRNTETDSANDQGARYVLFGDQ